MSSPGFKGIRDSFCHGAGRFSGRARSTHSTSMKKEMSTFNVGNREVNEKRRVDSLRRTALPLMKEVKLEKVVPENATGSGADPS